MSCRIKEYNQSQNWLFAPSIEELIPTNHPVRIVNNLVEKIDLKPHLENHKKLYNELPEELTADAGYGSEENYELLEDKAIKAFVKFNTFDQEQGKSKKRKIPNPLNETHSIIMKRKIFMYARWDNVWKRAVRKKSKQNQHTNKPTVVIALKTARVVRSEASALKGNTTGQ